jgi:hypothetical protein
MDGHEEDQPERHRFEVVGTARIEVRSGGGPIEVRGATSREVVVLIRRRARAFRSSAARDLVEGTTVEARQRGNDIRVNASPPSRTVVGRGRAWVEIEVIAPRRSELRLYAQDGSIAVDGIEGEVEAESRDGRIRIDDVSGRAQLRTADGSIVGNRLSGDVEAATGDGRIRLEGSFSGLRAVTSDGSIRVRCDRALPLVRDWLLRTADGAVEVVLPRDIEAEIEASTGDGSIVDELDLGERRESRRLLRGTLGGGGNRILVKTSDGRIRLKYH